MTELKLGAWYWIFWIAVSATILWIILKLLRIIETPLIFEVFPIISASIAIMAIGITLGNYFQKTNFAFNRMHKIESRQNRMAHGLINLENDVHIVKKDIATIKKDIATIKNKI